MIYRTKWVAFNHKSQIINLKSSTASGRTPDSVTPSSVSKHFCSGRVYGLFAKRITPLRQDRVSCETQPTCLAPGQTFTQPLPSLTMLVGFYPTVSFLTYLHRRTCFLLQLSLSGACAPDTLTCCFVRQPCIVLRTMRGVGKFLSTLYYGATEHLLADDFVVNWKTTNWLSIMSRQGIEP